MGSKTDVTIENGLLRECVRSAVEKYLKRMNGTDVSDIHSMVITEVEIPLFETVMAYTNGNQSKAAAILGINRRTLHNKLVTYGLLTKNP